MRAHKRMKGWIDDDTVFDILWIYDPKDPLVYQLWLPQVMDAGVTELKIRWMIGRELVRTGIAPDKKIGGQMDILVLPEVDGVTTIYLKGGDGKAVLLYMKTKELKKFNAEAHDIVSEAEEMNLAITKLLSEVK